MAVVDDGELEERWQRFAEAETLLGTDATLLGSFNPQAATLVRMSDEAAEYASPDPDCPTLDTGDTTASLSELPGIDGGFERFELIGRGGMGVVYRAFQPNLGRDVAIKTALGGHSGCSAQVTTEARIMGFLDHANIAPVHWLGLDGQQQPRLIMKFVQGQTWSDLIHAAPGAELSLREHIDILLHVCQAVGFAHEKGIIHRDIKPANIMVGSFGQVYLMDWGLAAALPHVSDDLVAPPKLIDSGEPLGTPGYMSPELAMGEGDNQDIRTDVYLLGACLHEVLTKDIRHRANSVIASLVKAWKSEPHSFDESVPAELADICNRSMACDRDDRFADVASLCEALDAYLGHEQVYILTQRARAHVKGLADAVEGYADLAAPERRDAGRRIEELHTEARFAFRNALEIWPASDIARQGLVEAHRQRVEHALAMEDLDLARGLVAECDDPGLVERVEALAGEIEARERELDRLRDSARQLDWRTVSRPLGNVFLFATAAIVLGLLVVTQVKQWSWETGAERLAAISLVWGGVLLSIGIVAMRSLRRSRVSATALSRRMMGTWGAVAAGCLVCVIASVLKEEHFAAGTATVLLGLGFAATAFQTRRWLLVPAGLLYLLSLPMFLLSLDLQVTLFGAVWGGTLLGLGILLKTRPHMLVSDAGTGSSSEG